MRDEGVVLLGKPIDNSRVVRQVDPRSRRELWLLILLVSVARRRPRPLRLARARDPPRRPGGRAARPREASGCIEENRKLRLEKAALENLAPRRGDRHARARACRPPAPERSVVVEVEPPEAPARRQPCARARGARDAAAEPEARP